MTACNRCGGRMVPDRTALIFALGCENCGRLIPATHRARFAKNADKRVLRAARRAKLAKGQA